MTQAQAFINPSLESKEQRPRLDLDDVPGPAPMPLVGHYGNMVHFYLETARYTDKLAYGGYGNVVSFVKGMRRGIFWPADKSPGAVFVFGRELIHQVMIKKADASFAEVVVAAFPEEWEVAARLNGGLLWMSGEPHKQRRKVVVPLYHQKQIQGYRDSLVGVIGRALDRIKPGDKVAAMELTGEILTEFQDEAVLGSSKLPGELAQAGREMVELLEQMRKPIAHFTGDIPFTPRHKMKQCAERVSRTLSRLIEIKRAEGATGPDILSQLMRDRYEDGGAMSEQELIAEIFGLFLGGWVSTRTSMAWTILLLVQHPKVMASLYEELDRVLKGAAPTVEQLKELPMLDHVINESHRLFPPIPLLTRVATQDVVLGGYRIPKRTEIYLSLQHTHRQPDVFPEPTRFKPERWRTIDPSPYDFLPFGTGSRTCPGMALAKLQMKLLLAMMLQRFRLETPRGTRVDCVGMGLVAPKPDVTMIVRKQDRRFERSRRKLRGNVLELVAFDK